MGLDTNMYLQRKKNKSQIQGYGTAQAFVITGLFCLPFHSLLNSTMSVTRVPLLSTVQKGPSSGTVPQVDNETGNNSSDETTRESHKLEQEKAS